TQNSQDQHPSNTAGTMLYIAPEQIRGKPCPASDQYALGVVAYEWLCGICPFNGSSPMKVALRQLTHLPKPPHYLVPSIPPAVDQVVLKALAKEPEERFASMEDFAVALERAHSLDHTSPLAYPPLQTERPPAPELPVSTAEDALPTIPSGPLVGPLPQPAGAAHRHAALSAVYR